jgi:hypothetical protein
MIKLTQVRSMYRRSRRTFCSYYERKYSKLLIEQVADTLFTNGIGRRSPNIIIRGDGSMKINIVDLIKVLFTAGLFFVATLTLVIELIKLSK